MNSDGIPAELKQRRQWVVWRYEKRVQTWTKIPLQPSGDNAKTDTPATWNSFEAVVDAYAGGFDGIGYVFSADDPYAGIDLDNAIIDGEIQPWAVELLKRFPTFDDQSPSDSGIKLFCRGSVPKGTRKPYGGGQVEIYSQGRFFTITGRRIGDVAEIVDCNEQLNGLWCELNPGHKPKADKSRNGCATYDGSHPGDIEIIETARQAKNGDKFSRLWSGDASGYVSQSEADLALCSMLAFWTGPNEETIDRLFRQSGLYREKWDRDDYSSGTIQRALAGQTEFYDWDSGGGQQQEPPRAMARHTVGAVEIVPGRPRRTATKLNVRLVLRVEGKPVDSLTLTDATSNRKQTEKAILAHVGHDVDNAAALVTKALAAILVEAQEIVETKADQKGVTVREIIRKDVPERVKLLYVTDGGKAFSEVLKQEISRSQFIERMCRNELVRLCETACDAPRLDDGSINRLGLVRLVEAELKLLWADILGGLQLFGDVQLGATSEAANIFREQMRTIWTKPAGLTINRQSFERNGKEEAIPIAATTSLVARLRDLRLQSKLTDSGRWIEIKPGFSAWARAVPSDGHSRILLAMRTELITQVRTKIDGVTDMKSLRKLGVQFGVIDPEPPVAEITSGGKARLVVLSADFSEELLDDPASPNADGEYP